MASIISAGTTSGTSLNLSGDTSGVLQLATNGSTTAVTITTAQNVGIGTSSPTNKLSVIGADSSVIARVAGASYAVTFNSDAGSGARIEATDPTGVSSYQPLITNGSLQVFRTGNTERMRIDSSGNVLIGQTSPVANEKLLVRDNVASSVNVRIRNDSTSASAGAAIAMNASGNSWGIECGSSAKNSNALTWLIDYGGTNGERLRLNTDGTLILRGGSTSATGTGITFPATQSASSDANTLDDYEEGTFTPTIIGGTTAGTASYNRQSGIYTKIGNRVFFTISIEWTSGTGTGALAITGLPFTQNSVNGLDIPYAVSECGNIAWDANYMPTPIGLNNTTTIYLNASRVGGSGVSINTNYDAAGGFSMTGHYRVA